MTNVCWLRCKKNTFKDVHINFVFHLTLKTNEAHFLFILKAYIL